MNINAKRLVPACCLLALTLLQGCATSIKASAVQNPPPKEAFSAYGRIEVKTTAFQDGYAGDPAALAKIDANIKKDLAASLESWNKRPANGRTLVIEPIVEQVKVKHVATRIFLGPLAGSSGVRLRVNIHDSNGGMVATPEFFQRADAMAAGFMLGVHDNLMLTRVSNLASSYVIANFERAQGGPTGADDKAIASQ